LLAPPPVGGGALQFWSRRVPTLNDGSFSCFRCLLLAPRRAQPANRSLRGGAPDTAAATGPPPGGRKNPIPQLYERFVRQSVQLTASPCRPRAAVHQLSVCLRCPSCVAEVMSKTESKPYPNESGTAGNRRDGCKKFFQLAGGPRDDRQAVGFSHPATAVFAECLSR